MTDLREISRVVRRHRALLAAGLVAGAVATGLPVLAPTPAATVTVVAATHDLIAGVPLRRSDVVLRDVPAAHLPHGVLTSLASAVGRAVAGPVRAGETLTDVRFVGAGLLASAAGLVAAPVRLADPATAALLHAGDHVDVLATPADAPSAPAPASTVAADLRVLAVPDVGDSDPDGALVVLAATPATAARLAGAAVGSRLSVTVLAA